MGTFDRLILFLYTTTMILVSGALLAFAGGWVDPLKALGTSLHTPSGPLGLGLAGAIFLLVSLRFLYLAFSRSGDRRARSVLIQEGKLGDVSVAVGAIANLVRRVATTTNGVREVKADVTLDQEGGVRAFIRAVVGPEVNIPDLAAELQKSVEERVRDVVGIKVEKVRVWVDNIATEGKRRRVE